MKRAISSIALLAMLLILLVLPAEAATACVQDYAGLLDSGETRVLEEWCQELKQSHDLDVVLLAVPKLMGKSAQSFADEFYENNRYSSDGVLFLIDMDSRQWHISTSGRAIDALSDRDLMKIEDRVIPYFSEGRYYDGFCRFLDILPDYLSNRSEGSVNLPVSLALGAAVAGIALFLMWAGMNTRKPQRSAENYISEGSYRLHTQQDLFLYSNISKREKPKSNSSSTHRSSSGTRHGGRGGRF